MNEAVQPQVDGYKLIICKKIDSFLSTHKVTNKDFGLVFGVSEGMVRHWRNGKGSMDINQIVKLCDYWNITLYELLDIKDPYNLSDIDKERLRKISDNSSLADIIDKNF